MRNYFSLLFIYFMLCSTVGLTAKVRTFRATEINQENYSNELSRNFTTCKVYEVNSKELRDYINSEPGKADVNLIFGSRQYPLQLQINEMRGKEYRAVEMSEEGEKTLPLFFANTYKGYIRNNPADYIRLTIDDGLFEGYINDNGRRICFDRLSRYVPNAGKNLVVTYYPEDISDKIQTACGFVEAQKETERIQIPSPEISATGNCHYLHLATEADYDFYLYNGSNIDVCLNQIRSILNQVEGDYTASFNVKFILTYQQVWSTVNDPYVPVGSVLTQFHDWWNLNRTNINRDLAHMFTGIGIGWGQALAATVCNIPQAYSVTGSDSLPDLVGINLVRHEIGHNFSANHDTINGCSTIMCPTVGNFIMPWSVQSATEINNYINTSAACLAETFSSTNTVFGVGVPYSFIQSLAINQVNINSAAFPVEISAYGLAHFESGNEIVISPTNPNSTGFIANTGSSVLMRISDLINTCDPLLRMQHAAETTAKDELEFYPNPASAFVRFMYTGDRTSVILKFYNSTMQMVKMYKLQSGADNNIAVHDLPPGIYIVDVVVNENIFRKKLVINR